MMGRKRAVVWGQISTPLKQRSERFSFLKRTVALSLLTHASCRWSEVAAVNVWTMYVNHVCVMCHKCLNWTWEACGSAWCSSGKPWTKPSTKWAMARVIVLFSGSIQVGVYCYRKCCHYVITPTTLAIPRLLLDKMCAFNRYVFPFFVVTSCCLHSALDNRGLCSCWNSQTGFKPLNVYSVFIGRTSRPEQFGLRFLASHAILDLRIPTKTQKSENFACMVSRNTYVTHCCGKIISCGIPKLYNMLAIGLRQSDLVFRNQLQLDILSHNPVQFWVFWLALAHTGLLFLCVRQEPPWVTSHRVGMDLRNVTWAVDLQNSYK